MSAASKNRTGVSPLAQIKALEVDPTLVALCDKYLPPNYDFEIAKTVWRIRKTAGCSTVALQMPEGLLIFASKIAQVLHGLTGVDTILMGDVTYGACCVDDFTASMLGAQLLVHYGHSCLVPTSVANRIETIYVFVTIKFNVDSCVQSLASLLQSEELDSKLKTRARGKIVEDNEETEVVKIALVSTIQFANSLAAIKQGLESEPGERESKQDSGGDTKTQQVVLPKKKVIVNIPRSKPLSNGEILGCTAPRVGDDVIIYVGDGRFHLEAMMMANPSMLAYRYDPYNRTITEEIFDHVALSSSRQSSVAPLISAELSKKRLKIGIIQGTLGRQGNPKPVEHVYAKLSERHDCFIILMSEVIPAKLALFKDVDLWVQFACPRLSIDWGNAFETPILTPFEAMWGSRNCVSGDGSTCSRSITTGEGGEVKSSCEYKGHPMDYYAYESLGPHTPNFMPAKPKVGKVA